MSEDLVAVPTSQSPARRTGGSRLEAILTADGACERARRSRERLFALTAVLGLPIWLAGVWPERFSPELRLLAATLWALAAAGAMVAIARTWWWQRVRADRLAALGPLPELRAARRREGARAAPAVEEDLSVD